MAMSEEADPSGRSGVGADPSGREPDFAFLPTVNDLRWDMYYGRWPRPRPSPLDKTDGV